MKKLCALILIIALAAMSMPALAFTQTTLPDQYVGLKVGERKSPVRQPGTTLTTTSSAMPGIANFEGDTIVAYSTGDAELTMWEKDASDNQFFTTIRVTVTAAVTGPTFASFTPSTAQRAAGEDVTLTLQHDGSITDTPSFAADSTAVANVKSTGGGQVTFATVAAGSTTLRAIFANGTQATCALTVLPAPGGLTFAATAKTLTVGGTFDLAPNLHGGYTTTGLQWQNANPAVATVSASGVITAVSPGSTILTASTYNGYQAVCGVTVQGASAPISLSHNKSTYLTDQSVSYTARDAGGSTVTAALVSSNPAVVQVLSNNSIRTLAAGSATITASYNGATAQQTLTVQPAPIGVTLSPASRTINVGEKLQLTPTIASGTATEYTYTSTPYGIVSVSADGLVTGLAAGTAIVQVRTHNGYTATSTVGVNASGNRKVWLDANPVVAGASTRVRITDASGNYVTALSYQSGNLAVASVDAAGNVTTYSSGQAVITCTFAGGATQQVTLSVYAVPGRLFISPASTTLQAGASANVTVTSNVTGTFGYTLVSSNSAVLRVDSNTRVTGVSAGSAVLTATSYNGVTASVSMTVTGGSAPTPIGTARVITTRGSLNLRDAAYDSAPVLIQIPQYATVTVYTRGAIWSQVGYGGYVGYAMSQYLDFGGITPTPTPQPTYGPIGTTATVMTQSGSLNLRERPVYGARILARVPQYATVSVISYGNPWSQVVYAGINGYVMSQYLRMGGVITPTAAPTMPVGGTGSAKVTTVSGGLNLRDYPGAGGRVLLVIPRGTWLTVTNKGASWCAVTYNGVSGYVMTAFLTFGNPGTVVDPSGGKTLARVVTSNAGKLNLRETAVLGSRILARIPSNTLITVISRGYTWCEVAYNGYEGFVMTRYLKILN